MKVKLEFNIECGETTCASAPGVFCSFMGVKNFGCIPVCMLFQETLEVSDTSDGPGTGWTQRCNTCKKFSNTVVESATLVHPVVNDDGSVTAPEIK